MDDFILSNLYESRNEWCSRLVSIFTPLIIEGIRSIFESGWKMCTEADEISKYLMTFQNLLSQIPKWNSVIVEKERQRIIERSGCHYLEDLITCVHIIQLKVLTAVRVGNRQKKIDISIPKLDHFIHKVYIHVARKLYVNVYLFEKHISPLQIQKNGRELEVIVQECILSTIRESIPTEDIIRAYLEEEYEHEEEVIIEPLTESIPTTTTMEEKESIIPPLNEEIMDISSSLIISPLQNHETPITTKLTFQDIDNVLDSQDNIIPIDAPKTIERLEAISAANAMQRKLDELEPSEEKLSIGEDTLLEFDALDDPMIPKNEEPEIMLDIEDII
jgi:Family of unknown function (DUF5764)